MQLPAPRGPLSHQVIQVLAGRSTDAPVVTPLPRPSVQLIEDADFQLSLWMLFELHYRGFDDVDPDLEWNPQLISARGLLERCFEDLLRDLTAADVRRVNRIGGSFISRLTSIIDELDRGSLATHLQRRATVEQFSDFMRQRSIYHLKESDPQSFVLPRIDGRAKVALSEIQYDEYGAGRPEQLHSRLFGDALEALGLDSSYGAYIDEASACTLAVNNVMSMFALRRRLRGASLGHLAAFETTSSAPCRRIVSGIGRLGLPAAAAAYFDEHVEADAVHEQVAIRDICAALVDDDPRLEDDVLFGAACCLRMDEIAGRVLVESWHEAPAGTSRAQEVIA